MTITRDNHCVTVRELQPRRSRFAAWLTLRTGNEKIIFLAMGLDKCYTLAIANPGRDELEATF